MRQETAEALEYEGAEDVRDDYSGRGMYGKTTHAVVFESWTDALRAIVSVAFQCGQNHQDDGEPDSVMKDLQKLRSDSMGRGIVLY